MMERGVCVCVREYLRWACLRAGARPLLCVYVWPAGCLRGLRCLLGCPPSVQVLWMCGGHQEHRSKVIESAGVQPKTRGDVEPCNPFIKSSLGVNRFTHVKDLLKVCAACAACAACWDRCAPSLPRPPARSLQCCLRATPPSCSLEVPPRPPPHVAYHCCLRALHVCVVM